ncbi:MAG: PilT/PilU family type 4a pilus ATPase [Phycisphaerae bacterium]|jgi:twitching motility protein PilT
MPDAPQQVLKNLLSNMQQLGASDMHLKPGHAPFFRSKGVLRAAKMPPVPDSEYIVAMLEGLIPESRRDEFPETGAVDFATRDDSGGRYRVNMFRSMGETHATFRRVLNQVPTFEELNLPPIYRHTIENTNEGLVLVSGMTGAGKSTTLASMVNHVNQNRRVHIVTIEDPIEFIFEPRRAIISQREIGLDVRDYHEALRAVVRQDPDCILIGELRDRQTIVAALQAAETGHLVFGSVHVADTQQTFNRILEYFPRAEHQFVRSTMASSFQGIFCQRLLPGIEPGTNFPATEVLIKTPAVKDMIMQARDLDIPGLIDKSAEEGMRSFTRSLCELVDSHKVHFDAALSVAPNRDALKSALRGIKGS